jgi:ascorbate-specific PTS system EIIC-type component UlaA
MLAVLGFGFGFAVNAMLLGYVSPVVAGLLGATLAISLAVLVLGLEYTLPIALSALVPLCFLNVGNAGLLLSMIGLILILSLMPSGTLAGFLKPRVMS